MSIIYSGDYLQIGTDSTATRNFVLRVPASPDGTITLKRGNVGAESATIFSVDASGNLGVTGAFTPAQVAGIVGTTTNNSAAAGSIGEYVESIVGPVAFPATGTWGDLTSISLTAGDWDVDVTIVGSANGAAMTANGGYVGVSITSGNSGTGLVSGDSQMDIVPFTATLNGIAKLTKRYSLSGTTTVYLKYLWQGTGGPPNAWGKLSARRRR